MASSSFTYTEIPLGVRLENPVRRNRLMSMLLQDRGVLRLISAPHGFGKTALSCEYGLRMFADGSILWIDASGPDFLAALDAGHLPGLAPPSDNLPDLLIIDDLPWLDEERAAVVAHEIDVALFSGTEVLVNTLPSADCLCSLQPDRILIRAPDLLVTEQECYDTQKSNSREDKAKAARMWKRARERFMGRVPRVAWGTDARSDVASCLSLFFDEYLPIALFSSAYVMLLLGHGRMDDLVQVGVGLVEQDARQLSDDYPFLGLDVVNGFKGADVDLPLLVEAVQGHVFVTPSSHDSISLVQRVLAVLFERGDTKRFEEVLRTLCSDEHCASWLIERGWDLLDRGQVELVETLFDRCSEHVFDDNLLLQSLRAWANGLLGDNVEAVHYARCVLGAARSFDDDGHDVQARLGAYLALVAFGDGSMVGCGKEGLASPQSIFDGYDFLAQVVNGCLEPELVCALCIDEPARFEHYAKGCKPVAKRRITALTHLFTEHHDRFNRCLPYRIALHILHTLDSVEARRLVTELGCDIVVSLRRSGLLRYSEAVLVRDLWASGYFGLAGPAAGRRDALLLQEAARKLKDLARQRGLESPSIPWEAAGRRLRKVTQGQATERLFEVQVKDRVETMHVNMFGCFEVAVGDRFICESDLRKKSRALFIIVAVAQGRDVSRDLLLEQLWPDFPRSRALDNFYTVWSGAATCVGEGPWLEKNGNFCRINPHHVVSDVGEFEHLSRQLLVGKLDSEELLDIYAHIEKLYRGDLVPSDVGIHAIDAQRIRLKAMYVDSMVSASACALGRQDARLALWFARKAMEADVKREDVYFALIRAQVAAGQRCSAIRTYFECQEFLRDEMGLDPSCETKDLYDRLISVDPGLMRLEPATFDLA